MVTVDTALDTTPPVHPGDARPFAGHWYRYYAATLRWPEARARCEELGATLACIGSAEENAFVFALVPSGLIDGAQRPWLGGTNEARVDLWSWIDGSPWSYERWVPGQPDNPSVERWLKMNPDGAWDDATLPSSYVSRGFRGTARADGRGQAARSW